MTSLDPWANFRAYYRKDGWIDTLILLVVVLLLMGVAWL